MRTSRVLLIAAMLLLTISIVPPAVLSGNKESSEEVNNFQKVSAGLWRGAQPSDKNIKSLAQSGAKSIIDLRLDGVGTKHELLTARKAGLNYFHLPMGYSAPSLSTVITFLDIVTNPRYQPVFVHCRQGADRTGMLVAIYRMLVDGWSYHEAYKEMRSHHFKPWLVNFRATVAHYTQYTHGATADPFFSLLNLKGTTLVSRRSSGTEMLGSRTKNPGM